MNLKDKILKDNIGKYDFNYLVRGGDIHVFSPHTGYVALNSEFYDPKSPEVCYEEFNDLSGDERKNLAKALIDLVNLYRYGGNIKGNIFKGDLIKELDNQ